MKFILNDGESREVIEAPDLKCARSQAKKWVQSGDWNKSESTFWVHVGIQDQNNAHIETCTVAINPEIPRCPNGIHHWHSPYDIVGGIESNPGVWGNGGGVIINEVCLYCNCARITNTWAQDPSNGQRGLTSVEYDPHKYAASDLDPPGSNREDVSIDLDQEIQFTLADL